MSCLTFKLKINWLVTNLFWSSLSPVVQPVLTYEHTFLGLVDQRVKRHKGHDAG